MKTIERRIVGLEDCTSRRRKGLARVDFSNLTADDLNRFKALDWHEMGIEDCQAIVDDAMGELGLKLTQRMKALVTRDLIMAVILATFPTEMLRAIVAALEIDTKRRWSADAIGAILDHLPRPAVDAYLRWLDLYIAMHEDNQPRDLAEMPLSVQGDPGVCLPPASIPNLCHR